MIAQPSHADSRRRHPLRWPGVVVFALALALRAIYLIAVLHENTPTQIRNFDVDSRSYMMLADNLAHSGSYASDDPISHRYALLRPPAYPALLALLEFTGRGIEVTLAMQTLVASFIPLGVFYLTWTLLRRRWIATLAGIAAAVSPTGIASPAILLPDALLSACFLAGIILMLIASRRGRVSLLYAASAVFAAGVLLKPALLFWVLLFPVIWALMSAGARRPVRWGHLLGATLIQASVLGGWAMHNWQAEGIFAFSTIDSQNLRYFMAPFVEEWADVGRYPKRLAVDKNRFRQEERDMKDLRQGRINAAEMVRRQKAQALEILRAHPSEALNAYAHDVYDQLAAAWMLRPAQLTRAESPIARSFDVLDATMSAKPARFAVFGLMICAAAIPLFRGRREQTFNALALLLATGYFIALSGTTFATGWRVLYPIEAPAFALAAAGVMAILHLILPPRNEPAEQERHVDDLQMSA